MITVFHGFIKLKFDLFIFLQCFNCEDEMSLEEVVAGYVPFQTPSSIMSFISENSINTFLWRYWF